MIVIHFPCDVATELEQARADVTLQLAASEDLRNGAGRLTAPDFELKQAVAGGVEALREE